MLPEGADGDHSDNRDGGESVEPANGFAGDVMEYII